MKLKVNVKKKILNSYSFQEERKRIIKQTQTGNAIAPCSVIAYQITKTGKPNFIKGWQRPPRYKITIKIMEESRKPPDHNLMVFPPFYKLS